MNIKIPSSAMRITRLPISDQMWLVDEFLSENECSFILDELTIAYWRPSLTYKKQQDGSYLDILTDFRRSETGHQRWFSDDLIEKLSFIEEELKDLFDVSPEYLEYWQATRYPLDGMFDYHLDAGYWEGHYAGDRILTFLIYLTTPEEGGGTHFRALDMYIEAKVGRLLVWNNLFENGDCNHRMIHSSVPLTRGSKTTLVTFQRQQKFRL